MAIDYRLILLIIIIDLSKYSASLYLELNNNINCKYYIIEHVTFSKLITNINYIHKLYQFESRNVKINENYFRIVHNQFCFNNKTSLRRLKLHLDASNSFLFGIDMSNNNLSNDLFQFVISNHESEEIDMKLIRYLNLKNNNNISSNQFVLFNNLEALILDKNYQIVNNEDQTVHVSNNNNNKLRILSLNKCGLNQLSLNNTLTTSLIYLGLAENRLTDMTSANEYNTFNLFDNLISYNVEHLDLSFNRFHKLSTIKYLLNKLTHLKKLNFEKNLFSIFDTNEIVHTVDSFKKYSTVEINLRFNFIRNTSISYYKFYNRTNYSRKVSVKLAGNPLVCDCNSLWLLDELNKTIKYQQDLVKKREIEVISKHHNLDDSNTFMQRSKRIKLKEQQHQQRRLLFSSNIVQINDLDQMKCNFIDVQNYNENDLVPFSYDNKELNFDLELQKQNIQVKSIKYKEKLISSSTLDDYFCAYEDHCRAGDCDCCVFKHCHCRSICPRLCRCYFDSSLMQNVIDCSALNLIDVPSQSPIESATDMRLNSNTLKMLNSHSFFGFGQVKYLYLQNNQISFIAADSFEDLKYSLKLLNLADNKLSYLNGDEFYGLNELTILVLSSNPLKDIDNINFIGVNHLPSLRFFYLTETTLPAKKLNELIHYSKKSTNTSIRHQLVTTSTVITTKTTTTTTMATTNTISSNETQSTSTIKANHINTYYFYQLKLFNWYYFPIFVFIICLLLSLVIVITVVIVARKYESDESKNKFKNNKRDSTSDQDFSISFENDMHATTSKQDYHDSSTKPFIKKYNCFNATLVCSSSSRRESDSISSTSCSIDSKSGGLETDLVSKSIDNLSLEVNIYFNIIDQDYVSNYLLACLKKCNVIIPDTRFVLKPQTTKYVTLNKDYLKKLENNHNNLKANILIISDNFSENRPLGVGGDSLISIKNYKMSTLNGHNSSSGISSNSSNISIFNDNDSKFKCYLMNWSDDNNCFKIYLNNNLNNTLMLKDNFNLFNSSKTFSLNQRLMKRIYETSNKSISSDKRVSLQIKNDISSSYAFSDCLKSKLEKYFQHLCLKSATFSERNFSYVDYSKR